MEAQLEQFLGGQLQRGMYGQDPVTQYQLSETQADIERARDQQIEDLQRFGIIGGEGVSMGAGADVLGDFYDRSGRRMDAVRAAGTQRMLDTILPQASQFGTAQAERAHRAREFESGLNLDRLKLQQEVADASLARRKMLTEATGIEQFEEGVRQFERELDVGSKEAALDRALTTSESEAQREFAASESAYQREHEKAEAALGRQLTADESERLRTFTRDQSELDRALRREEAIGEIMTPEGFRRQSLAGRQMAQDESQFARELEQRQRQADRDRDLRQQEMMGYQLGPGGRREETLGARELGQRSAEAELDRALSREEISQRGELAGAQRALEREGLTGEVVGPGGRRMTTLESQRLADARDQFDRGLISQEQLAAQERALEREALTGEVVGPGGRRMATIDQQRLTEARDQFDRGLISQEELARQERQLEREALTGEVMTGGRRMSTVESQRVGLEKQRLADARDQFDRGLISQEQLTRAEQDLRRSEITGQVRGPGGVMQDTLRAKEIEADRQLREAGITGMYGEDETLAARQLEQDRLMQEAGLTGRYGDVDTLAARELEQRGTQFEKGLSRDYEALSLEKARHSAQADQFTQQLLQQARQFGVQLDYEKARDIAERELENRRLTTQEDQFTRSMDRDYAGLDIESARLKTDAELAREADATRRFLSGEEQKLSREQFKTDEAFRREELELGEAFRREALTSEQDLRRDLEEQRKREAMAGLSGVYYEGQEAFDTEAKKARRAAEQAEQERLGLAKGQLTGTYEGDFTAAERDAMDRRRIQQAELTGYLGEGRLPEDMTASERHASRSRELQEAELLGMLGEDPTLAREQLTEQQYQADRDYQQRILAARMAQLGDKAMPIALQEYFDRELDLTPWNSNRQRR